MSNLESCIFRKCSAPSQQDNRNTMPCLLPVCLQTSKPPRYAPYGEKGDYYFNNNGTILSLYTTYTCMHALVPCLMGKTDYSVVSCGVMKQYNESICCKLLIVCHLDRIEVNELEETVTVSAGR